MDVARITELQPKTYVEQGDYIAIDNQSDGTKKVQFTNLLDSSLSIQNKAADAQATGEAISELNTDINTEALTRQSTDNNLQAQIDQLVAPSGTAPNPAEIENARIGADGVTYDTLGNAIRTQVTNLKSELEALSGFSIIHFTDGGYIATSGNTVNVNTVTSNSLYRYAVLNCAEGDKFTINGEGGSIPRLWCFIDTSGNVLSNAADVTIATDLVLTAPTNAAKLIINDKKSGGVCYAGIPYTIPDAVSELNERIDTESDKLDALKAVTTTENYEAVTFDSEETGTAYNTDNTSGTVWSKAHSFIKAVTSGEKYSISTTVIANPKYYAVLYYNDTTYVSGEVQGISGTQQAVTGYEFTIPLNVNKIIVCTYTADTPTLALITLSPYIDTSVGGTVQNYAIYDGTTLSVKCRYNTAEDLVVQMKKRGNNNLFDFDRVFTCPRSDVLNADVSSVRSILTANTDCFSPHQVRAISNIDGDSSDVFLTGGNHNHNDVPTATCTSVRVYIDGKKITNFSGLCSHIRVEWTNMIQGYNTWKSNGNGRAVLQEDITLDISGNTFEARVKQTALEDIYQAVYYGLQSINTPYSTILFVGGTNRTAEAISTARNSGDLKARRTYAINTSTHDVLETYVSPEDLGSFDFTGVTYSIFTANNKCYYSILRDQSLEMVKDAVYYLFGHYRFWSES